MPPIQSAFGRATVLSMRTRQMQDRVCFEMANIKQTRLKMEEKKENSLSEKDKERIKQAVLESAAKNTNLKPNEVAAQLCEAFTSIQAYTYSKSQ